MEPLWNSYENQIEYSRNAYGILMDFFGILVIFVGSVCHSYVIPVGPLWTPYGIPMEPHIASLWNLYGTLVTIPVEYFCGPCGISVMDLEVNGWA